MNEIQATALARLRAADPATLRPDPSGPYARAMRERVLAADTPTRPRARPTRRWIAVGSLGAAAAAAVSVLAVTTPWSQGQAASAYTVDRSPDGSLDITIQLSQLQDPARLNAELQRENAHTVALRMTLPAERCSISPTVVDQFKEPAPNSPEKAAIAQSVSWGTRQGTASLIIHPEKIPLNQTLVVAYAVYRPPYGQGFLVSPRVVPSVPRCLPAPPLPSMPTHTSQR